MSKKTTINIMKALSGGTPNLFEERVKDEPVVEETPETPVVEADDKKGKVEDIIKALIDTKFSGSNDEQGKAAQLFKGLAFSEDPISNKFMKKLDDTISGWKVEDFK